MEELKDALQNVKDLPQAITQVTTFADAVSLLKIKVADGLREQEASLTPPATQARRVSENVPPARQNQIAPTASSSTLNWHSQPPPPTPASLATPPSPSIPAETVAAIKLLHDDIAYLKVAGMSDLPGVLRKFMDVATTQGASIGTAADRLAELGRRIDAIEVVAARKSGEGASTLESAPANAPPATTTLKRKAPVRKPKAEPADPAPDSIDQASDVFGPVVPIEAEGPANKKKKAAPKKRAATTAAPKKPPARAATTAKKAPVRSATTAPARGGRAQAPVIVLDSDDSLESRSPDTPSDSPLASVNDSNVIPLDIELPMHVTRSVVRRLSSPVASTSTRAPAPRSPPAVPNFAVASASGSGGNLPPARTGFARLASPDEEEEMDEAAMDAQIGIF